jgi:4-amino-4-deoxy-L-arabinose transferase-like glycosyltransferase
VTPRTLREIRPATAGRLSVVALALIVACFATAGWWGLNAIEPYAGYDGGAFIGYASVLDDTGRIPVETETYEYAAPPAYFIAVIYAQHAARAVAGGSGSLLPGSPSPLRRALWVLAVVGAAALLAFGRGRGVRIGGLALGAFAVLWALADALSLAGNGAWRAGQLVALAWGCGLICVAWLLAREAWPTRPLLWTLAALGTAVLPPVIRMSVMFHPETQVATLCLAAVLVTVRSRRRGWSLGWAVALGAVLGLAALTRQSTVAVAAGLALAVLLLEGRRSLRYLLVAAAALLLVAGPWSAYQTHRTGNPIQSNLVRPNKMLDHQPRSFYVSFPLHDLIRHPYREAFRNELLPRIHADIWSDWAGGIHGYWVQPTKRGPFFASTQSVLGFFADLLCLGGLAVIGGRGIVRARRGSASASEVVLGVGLVVSLVVWAAFVVTLVRFPQFDGDPIKSTYMLFLGPLFVLGALGAGLALWRRWPWFRVVAVAWALLYAASYAGHLASAFGGY